METYLLLCVKKNFLGARSAPGKLGNSFVNLLFPLEDPKPCGGDLFLMEQRGAGAGPYLVKTFLALRNLTDSQNFLMLAESRDTYLKRGDALRRKTGLRLRGAIDVAHR